MWNPVCYNYGVLSFEFCFSDWTFTALNFDLKITRESDFTSLQFFPESRQLCELRFDAICMFTMALNNKASIAVRDLHFSR